MKSGNSGVLKAFLEYSTELRASLDTQDEVIGLVLVGSTADTHRVDEWSDHDFFVVTKPGSAEGLRPESDLSRWASSRIRRI